MNANKVIKYSLGAWKGGMICRFYFRKRLRIKLRPPNQMEGLQGKILLDYFALDYELCNAFVGIGVNGYSFGENTRCGGIVGGGDEPFWAGWNGELAIFGNGTSTRCLYGWDDQRSIALIDKREFMGDRVIPHDLSKVNCGLWPDEGREFWWNWLCGTGVRNQLLLSE